MNSAPKIMFRRLFIGLKLPPNPHKPYFGHCPIFKGLYTEIDYSLSDILNQLSLTIEI